MSRSEYSIRRSGQTTIPMAADGAAPVVSMGSTTEFLSESGASRLSLGVIRRDLLQDPQWRVLLPEARALGDDRDDPPDCVAAAAGSADAAAAKAFAARHGI